MVKWMDQNDKDIAANNWLLVTALLRVQATKFLRLRLLCIGKALLSRCAYDGCASLTAAEQMGVEPETQRLSAGRPGRCRSRSP